MAVVWLIVIVGIVIVFAIRDANSRIGKAPEMPKPKLILPADKPVVNELAMEVNSIYSYSLNDERMGRSFWVCTDCETENSDEDSNCALCGTLKQKRI